MAGLALTPGPSPAAAGEGEMSSRSLSQSMAKISEDSIDVLLDLIVVPEYNTLRVAQKRSSYPLGRSRDDNAG
jgi:hypothetical protein